MFHSKASVIGLKISPGVGERLRWKLRSTGKMHAALKLRLPNVAVHAKSRSELVDRSVSLHRPLVIRRQLAPCNSVRSSYAAPTEVTEESFVADSLPSVSTDYVASVGSPSSALRLSQWNLTQRHIVFLNVVACVVAASATWLFFSAIPAILAFRKAAESLEKLMDTTREELPDTMAILRLSGMEINDLTTELSDLGQRITQGVRSSTRAVRVAEESLRQFSTMTSPASLQRITIVQQENEPQLPELARRAKGIREGITKGRSLMKVLFTLSRSSRMVISYFSGRVKKK